MLSVQSLQTLRGAAAARFCRYSRLVGALSLACSPSYAFSRRCARYANSLPCRVEQPAWLGQHAAFTRRLDSPLAAALQRRRLITAVSCRDA